MKYFFVKLHMVVLSVFTLLPTATMAQQYFGPIDTYFVKVVDFINNILIPFIFTISLIVFIYGMFQYFILNGDDPKSRESGQGMMISAVVGFVLMISIWAIVNLLASGLFGTAPSSPRLPGIPTL